MFCSIPRRNSSDSGKSEGSGGNDRSERDIKRTQEPATRDRDAEEEEGEEEEVEEEWDPEEEEDTVPSIVDSPRTKRQRQLGRNDSTCSSESASRELSSSEGGGSGGSVGTRRLLSEMECGAYNSDSLSLHSSGVTTSEASPASAAPASAMDMAGEEEPGESEDEEEEDGCWSSSTDQVHGLPRFFCEILRKIIIFQDPGGRISTAAAQQQAEQVEGQLICHLEETFSVLEGAYRHERSTTYNFCSHFTCFFVRAG